MNKTSDRRQLPRVFPTRIYFRCQNPLHAANETGALEGIRKRNCSMVGCVQARSFAHFGTPLWEESREIRTKDDALTEIGRLDGMSRLNQITTNIRATQVKYQRGLLLGWDGARRPRTAALFF